MKDLLDQLNATHEAQGRLLANLNQVLAPIFGRATAQPRLIPRDTGRGLRQTVPDDLRAEVLKLEEEGKTIGETVRLLGISKSSVSRFRALKK
jgi:hypothetical protein